MFCPIIFSLIICSNICLYDFCISQVKCFLQEFRVLNEVRLELHYDLAYTILAKCMLSLWRERERERELRRHTDFFEGRIVLIFDKIIIIIIIFLLFYKKNVDICMFVLCGASKVATEWNTVIYNIELHFLICRVWSTYDTPAHQKHLDTGSWSHICKRCQCKCCLYTGTC